MRRERAMLKISARDEHEYCCSGSWQLMQPAGQFLSRSTPIGNYPARNKGSALDYIRVALAYRRRFSINIAPCLGQKRQQQQRDGAKGRRRLWVHLRRQKAEPLPLDAAGAPPFPNHSHSRQSKVAAAAQLQTI
jgi:hypothetical protein